MKFCKNCGYGVDDHLDVCGNCNTAMDATNTLTDEKLTTLADRVKINGIIWLVIGILQIVTGAFFIVGILNIFSAISDMKVAKEMHYRRVGLVQAYTPMFRPVVTLIYNLIFGGVIGVVGSLYYFICIRGYVMENKEYFDTLR